MLTRLDHIVLVCADIHQAIADYTKIFGSAPCRRSVDEDAGIETALFSCANTALEIIAAVHPQDPNNRISELLGTREGLLTSLAFETDDIDGTRHVLSRRGLEPTAAQQNESIDGLTSSVRKWQSFRCGDTACAGIKTFVLQNDKDHADTHETSQGGIEKLDHIVINTPNPERAIAHYGARLGLRFALDRTIEKFQTRFLFFRIGGLTLEVIHRLDQDNLPETRDSIWGLTWAVSDLEQEHQRLLACGLDVSDIRTGRKPGSQVFTLRSGTVGIPTLFIAHTPKETAS